MHGRTEMEIAAGLSIDDETVRRPRVCYAEGGHGTGLQCTPNRIETMDALTTG